MCNHGGKRLLIEILADSKLFVAQVVRLRWKNLRDRSVELRGKKSSRSSVELRTFVDFHRRIRTCRGQGSCRELCGESTGFRAEKTTELSTRVPAFLRRCRYKKWKKSFRQFNSNAPDRPFPANFAVQNCVVVVRGNCRDQRHRHTGSLEKTNFGSAETQPSSNPSFIEANYPRQFVENKYATPTVTTWHTVLCRRDLEVRIVRRPLFITSSELIITERFPSSGHLRRSSKSETLFRRSIRRLSLRRFFEWTARKRHPFIIRIRRKFKNGGSAFNHSWIRIKSRSINEIPGRTVKKKGSEKQDSSGIPSEGSVQRTKEKIRDLWQLP